MATAAKSKLSEILTDAVQKKASTQTRTHQKEEATETPDIQANTFYKIMFSQALTPEQKRAEVAKALVHTGSREEMKTRLQEFEGFKEYLQAVRENMAKEIISLTDTETFSELKKVYDELNTGVLSFEEKMKPLTDIIDALYALRTEGKTMQVFEEVKKSREEEDRLKKERSGLESNVNDIANKIDYAQCEISRLGEDKSFFGLGGIKKSSREQIARKNLEISKAQEDLQNLGTQITEINEKQSKLIDQGEFAEQKKKLRELLDISTEEHRDRQKALVGAALDFVNSAKTRIGEVRNHLGKMNDQVDNLFSANGHMTGVYAILNEGVKEAEKDNQQVRETLVAPPKDKEEDLITRMQREQKKMDVEDHITRLDTAAADTLASYADLTSQTVRIKDMREANTSQINRARALHTQGVAAVADRLSTVLQAVSSAALGESSAMAKETLNRVNDSTNQVAMKESIRVAMGMEETTQDLAKAIEDLGAYGEVVRTGTKITTEAVAEMRAKLEELQEMSRSVHEDIHESVAAHAKVALGLAKPKNETKSKPVSTLANPFGAGN